MDCRTLTAQLAVGPQVRPEDMTEVVSRFGMLINNRPDNEEPGQPSSDELRAAAERVGLRYVHIPVVGGQIDDAAVDAFKQELRVQEQPVLAFCRTGTRSASLWALGEAGAQGADAVLSAAERAGYDITGLRPRLEQVSGQ